GRERLLQQSPLAGYGARRRSEQDADLVLLDGDAALQLRDSGGRGGERSLRPGGLEPGSGAGIQAGTRLASRPSTR
ncbi:MAG: hypothetical protein ABSF48_14545, partial [Thermodesulfobacteriota bacterium]